MACMPSDEHFPGASSGQDNGSCKIELVNAVFVRPRKGRFENSNSYLLLLAAMTKILVGTYARIPNDQKSTGAE